MKAIRFLSVSAFFALLATVATVPNAHAAVVSDNFWDGSTEAWDVHYDGYVAYTSGVEGWSSPFTLNRVCTWPYPSAPTCMTGDGFNISLDYNTWIYGRSFCYVMPDGWKINGKLHLDCVRDIWQW